MKRIYDLEKGVPMPELKLKPGATAEVWERSFKAWLRKMVKLGEEIKLHLTQSSHEYDRLLIKYGRMFVGREHSTSIPIAKEFKDGFKPELKQCFYNSQMFTVSHPEAIYCECYWIKNDLGPSLHVITHGWNLCDGKTVDLTGEAVDAYLEREPRLDSIFYGVEISRKVVLMEMAKNGYTDRLAEVYFGSLQEEASAKR